MFRSRQWWTVLLTVVFLGGGVFAWAASFTGTVESVDADGKTIALGDIKNVGSKSFTLGDKVSVTSGSKKSSLEAIEPGAQVTVYTDSKDVVTRITLKPAATTKTPAATKKPTTASKGSKPSTRTGDAVTGLSDWPSYDGPNRDNQSHETGLLSEWPNSGPKLTWTAQGMGQGYASVSVSNGLVFTYGNVSGQETVSAVDLKTGDVSWQTPTGAASKLSAGDGPRGTPTVDGETLYALGGNGDLTAMEAASGKKLWSKNILEEFGGNNIQWGISESVLIDGERLICTPGGRQATLVALNKKTGSVLWRSLVPGGVAAGYSSAIPIEVGSVRQYVQFTAKGLVGVKADTGQVLWANDSASNGTANCSSPLFFENTVFYASGYGTGGTGIALAARGKNVEARQLYHTDDMKNHHGGMVCVDGHVYGSNDPGILVCLDIKTGRVKWQNRSVGKGAVTYADGHIYLRSEGGPVALVEANPSAYVEKGRFDQPNRSGAQAWPHPVVAQGKLFLRDQNNLLAFEIKDPEATRKTASR